MHRSLMGLLAWLQNPRTVSGGSMPTPIDMSIVERVDRPYLIGAGTFLVAAYFRSNAYATDLPDTRCIVAPHNVRNRAEVRTPGRSNNSGIAAGRLVERGFVARARQMAMKGGGAREATPGGRLT